MGDGRLLVKSEMAERIVKDLLLVGEVGDKVPVELVFQGRPHCLHICDVVSYTGVVRLTLCVCVCVCGGRGYRVYHRHVPKGA